MSGGSFDYAFFKVREFAEELRNRIDDSGFSDETKEELRNIAKEANTFADKMKSVEWMFSADIGEQEFLRNIRR